MNDLVLHQLNGVVNLRKEHWTGVVPVFEKHLRAWGESGAVKLKKKIHLKLIKNTLSNYFKNINLTDLVGLFT